MIKLAIRAIVNTTGSPKGNEMNNAMIGPQIVSAIKIL
jgi:hypothetical protein